jgi:hypothetical protein
MLEGSKRVSVLHCTYISHLVIFFYNKQDFPPLTYVDITLDAALYTASQGVASTG